MGSFEVVANAFDRVKVSYASCSTQYSMLTANRSAFFYTGVSFASYHVFHR